MGMGDPSDLKGTDCKEARLLYSNPLFILDDAGLKLPIESSSTRPFMMSLKKETLQSFLQKGYLSLIRLEEGQAVASYQLAGSKRRILETILVTCIGSYMVKKIEICPPYNI